MIARQPPLINPETKVLLLDVSKYEDLLMMQTEVPEIQVAKKPSDALLLSTSWTRIKPQQAPSMQYLINRSMGQDYINYPNLYTHGVKIKHIGDFCSDQVTQYVLDAIESTSGLSEPRVAIVGLGRIGKKVSNWCSGRGYHTIWLHHDSPEPNVEYALQWCSHLTLHLPLTPMSLNWLDAKRISYLNNVVVINTARGKLVNTPALLKGLEDKSISYACLDVVSGAYPTKQTIRVHPRVKYTGHTAWYSPESRKLRAMLTIAQLKEALHDLS